MNIMPEQKVTSDNFKAHILTLKNELRSVSEELDSKMRLKEITSKELDEISAKKDKIINETSKLNKEYQDKLNNLNTREASTDEREKLLKNNIQEFKAQSRKERDEFEKYKKDCERNLKNANEELAIVTAEIESSGMELQSIQRMIVIGRTENKELTTSNITLLSRNDELDNQYNEKISAHIKLSNQHMEEMEKWEEELKKAKSDVSTPLTAMREEQKQFEKALMNFEIRKARFQRYLDIHQPGTVLKI